MANSGGFSSRGLFLQRAFPPEGFLFLYSLAHLCLNCKLFFCIFHTKIYNTVVPGREKLAFSVHSCYSENRKGNNRPQRGWPYWRDRNSTLTLPKFTRVVFLRPFSGLRNDYLRLLKIKVSNAIMNIPKAIRSLKSKLICITSPSLCRMGRPTPLQ